MNDDVKTVDRDSESRNRIVSDIYSNFFVEAGAGSGKTTMLVSRMVAMVEAGVDISRICAITFTKAAANEFYERFQKLLIERSNPEFQWQDRNRSGQLKKPDDVTRERCRRALENIDLCFMGTIDSFCYMILSEHPHEAGIPSDSVIVTETDANVLYKQYYVKISEGEYGSELESLARTFRAFHDDPEEVYTKGISLFMGKRNVHFNYSEPEICDIDRDFADDRKAIIRAVGFLCEHKELMYTGNQQSLDAWENIDYAYTLIKRRWSYHFTDVVRGLTTLKNIRVVSSALPEYSDELSDVLVPGGRQGRWLEFAPALQGGVLPVLEKIQYDASMHFLLKCVPVLEKGMRDKGYLTFFDCLYYLRNMLRNDAKNGGKLIRYISKRHSCFLIDEFQDTDPMQAQVFFYLASDDPVEKWNECVPRNGSLFIVGDPKQSIYRFRSADVRSFLRVKKLFEQYGGEILSLSRNFRSKRVLCEYFNRVFKRMLPEETQEQSRFEEIPLPEETADEFQGIFRYKVYSGKSAIDNPDESDPVLIPEMIERLVGNKKYLIKTRGDTVPRMIRYSDIMVITYSKSALAPVMSELGKRDIPVRVEGQVLFGRCPALREIYDIYSAVCDSDDPISLYSALTGSVMGLDKEDILNYRDCGGQISLRGESFSHDTENADVLRVRKKIDILKTIQSKAEKLSPAALFSKIMDDLQVFKYVSPDNLEVLYYTLELIRRSENDGIIVSLKDGKNYMAELLSGESGEERCLSLNADTDCVHMANLHKVKGLEAPVVILAAATAKSFPPSLRVIHEENGAEGYVFSLDGERSPSGFQNSYFKTDEFDERKNDEKESLRAEGDRLVYVAATRAANILIISNKVYTTGKGAERTDSKWSCIAEDNIPDFFSCIDPVSERRSVVYETENPDLLYDKAAEDSILNRRDSEITTYEVRNPSRLRTSSKLAVQNVIITGEEESDELSISDDERKKDFEMHMFPALTGTMVHKLMEMLVSSRNRIDTESAVNEIISEYRTPAVKDYEEHLRNVLLNVAQKIRNGGYEQSDRRDPDILNSLMTADEVYCEVPYCFIDHSENENILWNGIMDVVYRTGEDWHIADYKTNAEGTGLDVKYRAQLDAYVKAFKMITGNDADAYIYHIDV